jgi:hypothetical protein
LEEAGFNLNNTPPISTAPSRPRRLSITPFVIIGFAPFGPRLSCPGKQVKVLHFATFDGADAMLANILVSKAKYRII